MLKRAFTFALALIMLLGCTGLDNYAQAWAASELPENSEELDQSLPAEQTGEQDLSLSLNQTGEETGEETGERGFLFLVRVTGFEPAAVGGTHAALAAVRPLIEIQEAASSRA